MDRAGVGFRGPCYRRTHGEHGRHGPEVSHRGCALRTLRVYRRARQSLAALHRRHRSRDAAPAMAQYPHLQQLQALLGGCENRSRADEMSAATVVRHTPPLADAARKRRHRLWIQLGIAAGTLATIALCVYGLSYYILPADARPLSPRHDALKPSGRIGNALGIVGGVLFLLMYLYPLRKRWRWLSMKGKTKNWLDYHILMGLVGPVLITFHSSFKLSGVAGCAYWCMIAVVLSGIVGRYLYGRIPRKLGAVEMSVDEAERLCADLKQQIRAQSVLT